MKVSRHMGRRGSTLLESIVTLGLLAILLAIGVIGLRRSRFDLATTRNRLLDDLQTARAEANTRGAHYRVTFEGDGYETRRLEDNDGDGNWVPDGKAVERRVTVPAGIGIAIEASDQELAVEFDTRGMLAVPPGQTVATRATIVLTDKRVAERARLEVWPSGQIRSLDETHENDSDEESDNND